jgi:hypothetical protein
LRVYNRFKQEEADQRNSQFHERFVLQRLNEAVASSTAPPV